MTGSIPNGVNATSLLDSIKVAWNTYNDPTASLSQRIGAISSLAGAVTSLFDQYPGLAKASGLLSVAGAVTDLPDSFKAFKTADPGSADQWKAGFSLVGDAAQIVAAIGTATGQVEVWVPANVVVVLCDAAKTTIQNSATVDAFIAKNGSPWAVVGGDGTYVIRKNIILGDVSRTDIDGTSIYVTAPDSQGNVRIQTGSQEGSNGNVYTIPGASDPLGDSGVVVPPITKNGDGTYTISGAGAALTVNPTSGAGRFSVDNQNTPITTDGNTNFVVTYVMGGYSITYSNGAKLFLGNQGGGCFHKAGLKPLSPKIQALIRKQVLPASRHLQASL